MSIEAVVTDVNLAADKPLGVRRFPLQNGVPFFEPVQLVFGEARMPGEPFYYSAKVVPAIGEEEVRVVLLMCNQQLL